VAAQRATSPVPAILRRWPVRVMPAARNAASIAGMDLDIVLSGGGERVIPWHLGVLAGLATAGHDPRGAGLIGTSAGAFVAARLAAGIDPRADALTARPAEPVSFEGLALLWNATEGTDDDRRRRLGAVALDHADDPEPFVAAIRARLPGGGFPRSLTVVAIDAESGRRVAFDATSGVPLERAVAASRAIPGLNPTIPIGGRRYMDGAVGSATNADVAAAGTVIVVSGVGERPAPRTPEQLWAAALEREVALLQADCRRVIVVRPARGETLTVAAGRRAGEKAFVEALAA
jgi:NTE family protein